MAASATIQHYGDHSGGGLALAAVAQDVPVTHIPALWPRGIKPKTRDWFDTRVLAGTATEARVALQLGWNSDGLTLHTMDGTIEGEGIGLQPLSFLPAISGVEGTALFDQQAFRIATRGGQARGMQASNGTLIIGNLNRPGEEFIDFEVDAVGSVSTALSIVNVPEMQLDLEERLGFGPDQTAGTAAATLSVRFPILEDLVFEDVDISVAADVVDGAVVQARSGIDLSALEGALYVDRQRASLAGTAAINEVPVTFEWDELFGESQEYETRMIVDAVVADTDWARLRMPHPFGLSGPVPAEIEYTDYGEDGATVQGAVDLTSARIAVPQLGYVKQTGIPARAMLGLDIADEAVVGVPYFQIEGPSLHVLGSADLAPGSLSVAVVDVQDAQIGDSRFSAVINRQDGSGWDIDVRASTLDARPFLNQVDEDRSPAIDARPVSEQQETVLPPMSVRFDVANVRISDNGPLIERVVGSARHGRDRTVTDRGWSIQADAVLAGGGVARAMIEPIGNERTRIDLRGTDAGGLLAALDVGPAIRGGRIRLEAIRQGRDRPRIDATLLVRDFTLEDTPLTARILAALSIGGLDDLLRGDGLTFSFAEARMRLQDGSVGIERGRAVGGELGLTADGVLSLSEGLVDLEGTVVPAAGINGLVSSVPVIGRLLTGVEGVGVFGFTYGASGPFSEPDISVNPLSILAPGVLRDLFFLETDVHADPGAALSLRPDRDE